MTVHHLTLMSIPCPHIHYLSTILLPQGQHTIYMCPDVILLISVDYTYTMYTPWETYIPWCYPISRLFLILLDPKSFQTTLDSSRPMTSCHVTSQSCALSLSHRRLIIILLLYLICSNPNPKVWPHIIALAPSTSFEPRVAVITCLVTSCHITCHVP